MFPVYLVPLWSLGHYSVDFFVFSDFFSQPLQQFDILDFEKAQSLLFSTVNFWPN